MTPGEDTGFVVRIEDRCNPTLTGGYDGCDVEVPVRSLETAQALAGALLEHNHTNRLTEGKYVQACAGGQRTVTLRAAAR